MSSFPIVKFHASSHIIIYTGMTGLIAGIIIYVVLNQCIVKQWPCFVSVMVMEVLDGPDWQANIVEAVLANFGFIWQGWSQYCKAYQARTQRFHRWRKSPIIHEIMSPSICTSMCITHTHCRATMNVHTTLTAWQRLYWARIMLPIQHIAHHEGHEWWRAWNDSC